MGGEWRTCRLGDVLELKRGYDLPTQCRQPGPFPIVSSSGISGWHSEAKVPGPGVVTGRYGTLGEVFYIAEDFWPLNTALYVRDFKGNHPRFISYFLKTINFHAFSDKAAVPGLNRNHLHSAVVSIPDTDTQRAIACILGSLDDKIELNRRMNRTLEEMARAIFKSWFIDFDPVRAKAAVRREHPKWTDEQVSRAACPRLKPEIARLFPDSFEDSELGEIPKGWEVKKLGDLLELAYGKALKAENRCHGAFPVYGSNGPVGWHNERLVTGPGIVVGRKGNPGIVTWVPTDFFPIDTTFYVVPKSRCQSLEFLYHALRNHDLPSLGADSAVPGLNRNLVYMSDQLLPPPPLLQEFSRITKAFWRRVKSVNDECLTLAALRDVLLPKLVSGELRVPDAERIAARCA